MVTCPWCETKDEWDQIEGVRFCLVCGKAFRL